jgi:hypothetical protein
MMNIEHFNGIQWLTLMLVTLFVEVAELEFYSLDSGSMAGMTSRLATT